MRIMQLEVRNPRINDKSRKQCINHSQPQAQPQQFCIDSQYSTIAKLEKRFKEDL